MAAAVLRRPINFTPLTNPLLSHYRSHVIIHRMSTRYIVVFKKNASPDAITKFKARVSGEGKITHDYNPEGKASTVLNGFAAEIHPDTLKAIQSSYSGADDPIDYVEEDSVVTIQ